MANSLDKLLANEKPEVVKRAQSKAESTLLEILTCTQLSNPF